MKFSIILFNQNSGHNMHTVTQWRTGTSLCPMKNWEGFIPNLITYPRIIGSTPANTVKIGKEMKIIASDLIPKHNQSSAFRFGKTHLVLSNKTVGNHYTISVCNMYLYLSRYLVP